MVTSLSGTEAVMRSVSLPSGMAEKLDALAASRRVSGYQTIVDLLGEAIAAYEQRRCAYLELADRPKRNAVARNSRG